MSVVASEADRGGSAGRLAWSAGGGGGGGGGGIVGGEKQEKDPFQKSNNLPPPTSSRGCWASFSGCVGGMWTTRQMTRKEDREVYVRTTLRELFIYIIFLTILCILTFGMTSQSMYYYTKVLNTLFLDTMYADGYTNYRIANNIDDFWTFAETVMLDALYWEYWYDPHRTPLASDDRMILYENKLLGVPRMRQIRVTNNSCPVPTDFQNVIIQCYDTYSTQAEDKEPFGLMNGTEWTYAEDSNIVGRSYSGLLATYSGSGNFIDFSTEKNKTGTLIGKLKDNLWITRGTRVVFLDFTVYNANINLFCIIKIVAEFPATGGMIPSWTFNTVKLLRYVNPMDYFVMACELIFVLFIIYYSIEEVLEMKQLKWFYFKSLWNILDLVVISLSVVCIGFNLFCTLTIGSKLTGLLRNPEEFADFESLAYWQSQSNTAVAMCIFFSWFKLFKYISFNKTMTQLSSTLSRCAKDVAGFAVMFFIVFFAFAQLGYLLFGTQVDDYNSFITAVFTLLRIILGDFNFNALDAASRVLGPIYFICYVFFVFFVLLNMFLAIINDTYSEVKAEIANQRNEFEIADYFKRGYNNMMGKFGRRDKLIDIENALKLSDPDNDGMLTFDDVRKNLKKCNFSDTEIECFFARYDIDGDRLLQADEVKMMLADIEGRKHDLDRADVDVHQVDRPVSAKDLGDGRPVTASSGFGGGVSQDEFLVLTRRVDHMEHSIGSIVNKIDVVLQKLDSMEKSKNKRKEAMGKLLDNIMEDDGVDDKEKRNKMEKLVRDELETWDQNKADK